MNDSTLFIMTMSLFFGFGMGIGFIRSFKGNSNSHYKLFAMAAVTGGVSVIQVLKYKSPLGSEIGSELLQIVFLGALAFGALLSCATYKLIKINK